MPVLRPVQRTGLDWLTGEVRQWQSEGWLEAEYAEQLRREHRASRRTEAGLVVSELVAVASGGLRALIAVVRRGAATISRLS